MIRIKSFLSSTIPMRSLLKGRTLSSINSTHWSQRASSSVPTISVGPMKSYRSIIRWSKAMKNVSWIRRWSSLTHRICIDCWAAKKRFRIFKFSWRKRILTRRPAERSVWTNARIFSSIFTARSTRWNYRFTTTKCMWRTPGPTPCRPWFTATAQRK